MRLEEINEEFRDYLISIAGCDTNFNWFLWEKILEALINENE